MAPRRHDRATPQVLRRSARIAAKTRTNVSGHVQEQSTEDETQGPKSVGGDVIPTVEVSNDEAMTADHQQTVSNATSSGEDVSMEDAGSDEDEGAVAADESTQDEDSIGDEEDEQSVEVEELSNQPHESKRCRFLELPRELRDEIYGYLVGNNRDPRPFIPYRAGLQVKPFPSKAPDGSTQFFLANRQIFEEGKALLYSQHFFVVFLKVYCNTFHPLVSEEYSHGCTGYRPLSSGRWDLSSITNLCLIINYFEDDRDAMWDSKSDDSSDSGVCYFNQWECMLELKKLRKLRIALKLYCWLSKYEDFPEDFPNDFPGRNPQRILWYRQAMRNLIAVIPKRVQSIEFGLDDLDFGDHGDYEHDMVPGSTLRATFEEFKHLQGTDAAAICPDED